MKIHHYEKINVYELKNIYIKSIVYVGKCIQHCTITSYFNCWRKEKILWIRKIETTYCIASKYYTFNNFAILNYTPMGFVVCGSTNNTYVLTVQRKQKHFVLNKHRL